MMLVVLIIYGLAIETFTPISEKIDLNIFYILMDLNTSIIQTQKKKNKAKA